MTNLPVVSQWAEDIYQIETTDNVLGGIDGIANKQALSLSNRTHWLKSEVEKRANKSGSVTETFNVKAAEVDSHAVNRKQMEDYIINLNLSNDFVKLTAAVLSSGQNWEGIDYIDSDAVGSNPIAKIYPDGTIVGSTDNGSYVKFPNGELSVNGKRTTSPSIASGTSTALYLRSYPILFISEPTVAWDLKIGNHSAWFSIIYTERPYDASTVSEAKYYIYSTYTTTHYAYISYIAKGRWK